MMCTRYNYGKKNTKRSNRKNENKDRIRRDKDKIQKQLEQQIITVIWKIIGKE